MRVAGAAGRRKEPEWNKRNSWCIEPLVNDPLNTDLYEVLGVEPGAADKEIAAAYKKLARELHPDVNPDAAAADRFKEITAAYDVLSDTDKRAEYDQFRTMVGQGGMGPGNFGPGGGSFNFGDGQFGGMEDMIGRLFGGMQGGSLGFKGADVRAKVQLTLDDVMNGAKPSFNLPDGGKVATPIPPGVEDGARLRVPGRGMSGAQGGPPGDLVLEISVVPHAVFERKGLDLIRSVEVDYATAVLGGTAEVVTFSGEKVKIKIPEGSQVGRIFRLRERGITSKGTTGDLLAKLTIPVPTKLTDEERSAIAALRTPNQPIPEPATDPQPAPESETPLA